MRREVTEDERANLRWLRRELPRVQGDLPRRDGGRGGAADADPWLASARSRARRTSCPTRSPPGSASKPRPATLFARYGYREIRTPIFEETQLFARGIGAETDIVSKEMYTFDDRDGGVAHAAARGHRRHRARGDRAQPDEHRPRAEGLRDGADVPARAAAEGPLPPVPPGGRRGLRLRRARWWTSRSSRWPSASSRPAASASYELVLNSVGDAACRPQYVETLRGALRANLAKLGRRQPAAHRDEPAARARLEGARGAGADRLAAEDRRPPLRAVPRALRRGEATARASGHSAIASTHRLVRGLDYYVKTTFEVTSGEPRRPEQRARRRPLRRPGEGPGRARHPRHRLRAGHGAAGPGPARRRLGERRCDVFLAPLAAPAVDSALRLQQRPARRAGLACSSIPRAAASSRG